MHLANAYSTSNLQIRGTIGDFIMGVFAVFKGTQLTSLETGVLSHCLEPEG